MAGNQCITNASPVLSVQGAGLLRHVRAPERSMGLVVGKHCPLPGSGQAPCPNKNPVPAPLCAQRRDFRTPPLRHNRRRLLLHLLLPALRMENASGTFRQVLALISSFNDRAVVRPALLF